MEKPEEKLPDSIPSEHFELPPTHQVLSIKDLFLVFSWKT